MLVRSSSVLVETLLHMIDQVFRDWYAFVDELFRLLMQDYTKTSQMMPQSARKTEDMVTDLSRNQVPKGIFLSPVQATLIQQCYVYPSIQNCQ